MRAAPLECPRQPSVHGRPLLARHEILGRFPELRLPRSPQRVLHRDVVAASQNGRFPTASPTRSWVVRMSSRYSSDELGLLRAEFAPYRRDLFLTSGVAVLSSGTELVVIYLLATLGTELLSSSPPDDFTPVLSGLSSRQLALALLLTVLLRGVLQLLLTAIQQRMLYRYEQQTRCDLLDSFGAAEWSLQASMESTEVHSAIFTYLNQARSALQSLGNVAGYVVSFVSMIVGSVLVGGAWTLLIAAGTVFLARLLRPLLRASRSAGEDARGASRSFVGAMTETIGLARENRLFGVTGAIEERNRRASEQVADANRRMGTAAARQGVLYSTAVYLVAALGITLVSFANLEDPAPYIAVVLLLYRGLGYGQSLQSSYLTMVSSAPAVDWLRATRQRLKQYALPAGGTIFEPPLRSLEFLAVSYAYDEASPALSEISFRLSRGDSLGIVGPSGSGKSTLVQLMLRLLEPDGGSIEANGVGLSSVDPASWFGHVVFVPQEARLANMSVLDNVLWYRDSLSRQDAVEALRLAHVLDEVAQLPDGLDTTVGEDGGRLSGGQRQRICIARALAGAPDVLILDEPTSALDLISEEAIRQTLEALRGQLTIVVVAHRLSTLRICDRVMVLNHGTIEALASRSELEEDNEFYLKALELSRVT